MEFKNGSDFALSPAAKHRESHATAKAGSVIQKMIGYRALQHMIKQFPSTTAQKPTEAFCIMSAAEKFAEMMSARESVIRATKTKLKGGSALVLVARQS